MFAALADAVVLLHLLWIVLVLIGVIWTRHRPVWTAVHLTCLAWGIIVEVGPWRCPLTLLENFLERRAGEQPIGGSFILYWVQRLIYPKAPYWLVSAFGVTACSLILAVYTWRAWVWWNNRATAPPNQPR